MWLLRISIYGRIKTFLGLGNSIIIDSSTNTARGGSRGGLRGLEHPPWISQEKKLYTH
jgi:hypothetical protein